MAASDVIAAESPIILKIVRTKETLISLDFLKLYNLLSGRPEPKFS